MSAKNIICFGFGQVAKNFIKKLKDQGADFKLTTTSREESTTKEFENIIYVEDGNQSKQKYLLFESQFIEKNWNIPDQESKFNSMDLNVLFEQQIIVMMNMVPLRDVHTGENFLQEENDDFLAPLEILNGASMCTYELDNE